MRIRTIKPSFFHHGDLFDLEQQTKMPIRVAYAGLWCAADREGRFKWKARELKAAILPYDDCDFSRVLDALLTRGFLVKYACHSESLPEDEASEPQFYGWIPSFKANQNVNPKEMESKLPDPCDSTTCTRVSRVPHAMPTRDNLSAGEGKGREGNMEGKGKERNIAPEALAVLTHLSSVTGKQYRAISEYAKDIMSKLKKVDGDVDGVKAMITRQGKLWMGDAKTEQWVRVSTLFGNKFHEYYDARNAPIPTPTTHRNPEPRQIQEEIMPPIWTIS